MLTRMVGPDFIPCYEALVFKLPGFGSSVPWHRDDDSGSGMERSFNVDIYPDDSNVKNSCVWVIPGSHQWEDERAEEMCRRGAEEFRLPGAVPAELKSGDVLLHHTMVVHGSTVNSSGALRRVAYFDNRALRWNRAHKWWDEEVMARRCLMYQYALYQRQTKPYSSDHETFHYQPPSGMPIWQEGDDVDLLCKRDP